MKQKIENYLKKNFLDSVEIKPITSNIPTFYVKREFIFRVVEALKSSEFHFNFLNDLTAVDWLYKKDYRFEVCYLLRSFNNRESQIMLKVALGENESIDSISSIFKGANWPEREVFDLFGIVFNNHPNLERIIMPDSFKGHPLRKDYPLEGFGQDYLIEDLLGKHSEDISD